MVCLVNFAMDTGITYILLVVALSIGYVVGKYGLPSSGTSVRKLQGKAAAQYLRGLNFLLTDKPDAAVDTLVELLEVNEDTFETHLSLGALLRQRGEVGHAIKFHQGLIENSSLSLIQQCRMRVELGLDFQKAGVLDQAERIFLQLRSNAEAQIRIISLKHLVEIYRDEREWPEAIRSIESLLIDLTDSQSLKWKAQQAHFYCELASGAKNLANTNRVEFLLKKAIACDPKCARASIELARVAKDRKDFVAAIEHFKRVPEQEPDYIPEILPELLGCYRSLNHVPEMIEYLKSLQDFHPSSSLLISLADLVKSYESESAAVELLDQKLKIRPSLRVIGKFLDFQSNRKGKESEAQKSQVLVRDLLELLVVHKSYYQCGHCGFSGNHLHWLCPSCKSWGTTRAVRGLEGE